MNFNVITTKTREDEDGNPVEVTKTTEFSATLTDGLFLVTTEHSNPDAEEEVEIINVLSQPFKPLEDGTREDWNSLEQAIEWFQDLSGHIGD